MSITLPPGCAPDDLTALNQCLDDLANASDLISKLLIDLINNDPAVAQAMVNAIARFGLSIPQVGVTDGSNPPAGDIGEWYTNTATFSVIQNPQTQIVIGGTLPAGDWDIWAVWSFSGITHDVQAVLLAPLPAGITGNMAVAIDTQGQLPPPVLVTSAVRALTTVSSGLVFQVATNQYSPGSAGVQGTLVFNARRRR